MTTSLLAQVATFIRTNTLIQPHDRILVGVSGGPDSTALLHLLHRLAYLWSISLGVVHFDHALRGAESRADASWVAELAAGFNLPFYLGTDDVRRHQREKKISLQTAARQLRLKFFQEVKQKHHYHTLALGHTADDQVELFFLRLMRGAGPEGVKGMWPHSKAGIIRPFLGISKDQIISWLNSEGLAYRFDKSNLSRNYRRNQLRLELIPQFKKYNPRFGEAITRFQALLQEQEEYLHHEAYRILSKWLSSDNSPVQLSAANILALHPTLQKRVLRLACAQAGVPVERLTSRHVSAALYLCRQTKPSGEISLPGNWRLVKENTLVVWQIKPTSCLPGSEYVFFEEEGTCTFLNWTFSWTTIPAPHWDNSIHNFPGVVLMDYQRLHFPLKLRTLRSGDRFQPLGMSGSKKLQDFFVDEKIPRSRRPCIPLLVSGEEIIWLAGHRLAESVKITPQTRCIFKLTAITQQSDSPTPG